MSTETVWLLIPECVLIATALAIYTAGAFVDAPKRWSWIAAGGILLSASWLLLQSDMSDIAGPASGDALSTFGRCLALAFGGLFVLLASRPLRGPGTSEYVGSLLLAVAGLMFVSGASELVLLFLGLELISIPTYILLYVGRRDARGQEATLKYFFLSILASAMLLYGFSFLYGTTGTTDLTAMRTVAAS
ncbi:MAG TPA: proton-conducting transporter membrane subunit, partial [Thermoguttaceae bacterium]|nr:proton-conducting transporter membrane subunit [Thermoguttaceae bacterium]